MGSFGISHGLNPSVRTMALRVVSWGKDVDLATLPPSYAECQEILETSTRCRLQSLFRSV